jgi:hypothetical protein
MEAASTSERLVTSLTDHTARNPEDSHLHTSSRDNVKYDLILPVFNAIYHF